MTLATFQKALAGILTDETLRREFLAERVATVRRFDLSVEDAAVLGKIEPLAIRNFADCLRKKRTLDVRKVLPLTCQVLGDEFDRLSAHVIQGPSRDGRHRADAAALVRHLCDSAAQAPNQPAWIADLARYEMAFVSARAGGACCILRYFRFPVAAIAGAVLSGRTPGRVASRMSIGLWLRLGKTKPLVHVCRTLGGSPMSTDIPWMVRQGDVALIAVEEIPTDAKPMERDAQGRVVLAYGEVTGHAHALHEPGVQMLRAANADVFLRVTEPASLRHEEHSRIAVPPGIYRVVRQREYTPEVIRTVAD